MKGDEEAAATAGYLTIWPTTRQIRLITGLMECKT
jgi:hypothetical protein